MNKRTFDHEEMLSAIKNANSILLCTHIFPDGDAIGSMLAMGLVLKEMGKQVTMMCANTVPRKYQMLQGAEAVKLPEGAEGGHYDLGMALDCGDATRMGEKCSPIFFGCPVTAQIDHHETNPSFARYNVIDGNASATGCIVMRLMDAMNVPLTKEIAGCLYVAISTDTGNCCFQNTTTEAFDVLSRCVDAGLDLPPIAREVHLVRERKHLALLTRALQHLHYFAGGRATGMYLTQEDFSACDALPEHADRIVNFGIDIEDVFIAYLADDRIPGKTKVSLRACPPCDVSKIAKFFGGGGHREAAGITMACPMDEACRLIEEKIEQQMKDLHLI